MHRPFRLTLAALAIVALAPPAFASFHFMQIEQVISDVCGDTSQQAIQLRMRAAGQNIVSEARLRAHDATGANPVMLIDMGSDVAISAAGARVLITSADFATEQGITPDFTLGNLIPASYLSAGRLTFEEDTGTIYWSLAWGGAGYTGSNTGNTTNDSDGNFGPPFGNPLPFAESRALFFTGAFGASSTNNAVDYAVTAGPATVIANNGTSVTLDCFLFANGFESGDTLGWSADFP